MAKDLLLEIKNLGYTYKFAMFSKILNFDFRFDRLLQLFEKDKQTVGIQLHVELNRIYIYVFHPNPRIH